MAYFISIGQDEVVVIGYLYPLEKIHIQSLIYTITIFLYYSLYWFLSVTVGFGDTWLYWWYEPCDSADLLIGRESARLFSSAGALFISFLSYSLLLLVNESSLTFDALTCCAAVLLSRLTEQQRWIDERRMAAMLCSQQLTSSSSSSTPSSHTFTWIMFCNYGCVFITQSWTYVHRMHHQQPLWDHTAGAGGGVSSIGLSQQM